MFELIFLLIFNTTKLFEKLQKEKWYFDIQKDWVNSIKISKWSSVLEIWSWPWTLTNYIFSKWNGIIWIDNSENMLKTAKKNYPKIKFFNTNQNFQIESFDFIIWSSILNIIDNKKDFLNKYYKLLKKWWIMSFLLPSEFMSIKNSKEIINRNNLSWFWKSAINFWFNFSRKMSEIELKNIIKDSWIEWEVKFKYFLERNLISLNIEK